MKNNQSNSCKGVASTTDETSLYQVPGVYRTDESVRCTHDSVFTFFCLQFTLPALPSNLHLPHLISLSRFCSFFSLLLPILNVYCFLPCTFNIQIICTKRGFLFQLLAPDAMCIGLLNFLCFVPSTQIHIRCGMATMV